MFMSIGDQSEKSSCVAMFNVLLKVSHGLLLQDIECQMVLLHFSRYIFIFKTSSIILIFVEDAFILFETWNSKAQPSGKYCPKFTSGAMFLSRCFMKAFLLSSNLVYYKIHLSYLCFLTIYWLLCLHVSAIL